MYVCANFTGIVSLSRYGDVVVDIFLVQSTIPTTGMVTSACNDAMCLSNLCLSRACAPLVLVGENYPGLS